VTGSGGTVNNSGSARTLTLGGSGSYSFGGDITATTPANLSVNVALTGNGSQTLGGTTHYAGATTVASGKLIVDGNISASSGVTVNNGATLGGSGTTSSVNAAGIVSPGTAKGILSTGNLTLGGGTLAIDLSKADVRAAQAPLAGTDYDQLGVGGTVSLSSATLALSAGSGLKDGDLYFVLVNDSTDAINGTFTGLANNSLFTTQGLQFQISYVADSVGNAMSGGNDIALLAVAVPEPSTLSLLALGGLAMLRRRRRANAATAAR
jgi:autotransporter-associated beta strand protein